MKKTQKQTTNSETILTIDDAPAVKELLTRQADIAKQIAELETKIESARQDESIDRLADAVLAGKEPTETLPQLQRRKEVLTTAAARLGNQLTAARQAAAAELIQQRAPEIEAVKTATGRAAVALRDALIDERRYCQKLLAAGISHYKLQDLFPAEPRIVSLAPDGLEQHPDSVLTKLAILRGQ